MKIIKNYNIFQYIIRYYEVFGISAVRYIIDLALYFLKVGKKTEHNILYKGKKIFYRTRSSDIILIHSIICGKYRGDVWEGEYDVDYHISSSDSGCLDLGANIGIFSILFALKYPHNTIIAVEPEIENYQLLKKNTEQFDNIIPINCGVWSHDAYLKVIDRMTGDWGFKVEEVKKEDADINGRSIDKICEEYNVSPEVVKMDIEGSEYEIFCRINTAIWINQIRELIIELHEDISPGVTKLIHKDMANRGFTYTKKGENEIYVHSE